MMTERITEVNLHCLQIASELISIGQYVTIEKVLQIILSRYGVNNFEDLGTGSITNVPSLMLLLELNKKVTAFLTSYFSTRTIITLQDVDWECVQF